MSADALPSEHNVEKLMSALVRILPWRLLICGAALVTISCFPSFANGIYGHNENEAYAQKTVTQLIDELVQIDSLAPGIDSAAVYEGFITDGTSTFEMGTLGVPAPKVPLAMRELVRRGPLALAELVRHVDDKRPTKLQIGNINAGTRPRQVGVSVFSFTYFSDEYDPRVRSRAEQIAAQRGRARMEKNFSGGYTVKVGDICFVLIGQIVNRRMLAVRYQPSGGLVVNSPVEFPPLAEKVRADWRDAGAELLQSSLLADIHGANRHVLATEDVDDPLTVFPALQRLRLYFPDSYWALTGEDLKKRKAFEAQVSDHRDSKSR
jgi:hypothetical protein